MASTAERNHHQQNEKYYETAQKVDAKFFLRFNDKSSMEKALEETKKLYKEPNQPNPLSGKEFRTSSHWRIHHLRDLTVVAKNQENKEFLLSFGEDEIKLTFNSTKDQPGNALLSYKSQNSKTHKSLSYKDIFKQEFFTLRGSIVAEVIKNSRTSGRPITSEQLERALGNNGNSGNNSKDEWKDWVWQLNHFMLLLDFEITRHLQLPNEEGLSQQYSNLPIGVGIAILSRLNSGELLVNKDTLVCLFSGPLQLRKKTLQDLITRYVREKNKEMMTSEELVFHEKHLEEMFFQLLSDEFDFIGDSSTEKAESTVLNIFDNLADGLAAMEIRK